MWRFNQFFSKTAENVAVNGLATVMVVDGHLGLQYILDLVYETSMTKGPVFETVNAHLEVMSVEQGMGGIMKLRAVDIYRVEDCRLVPPAHPLEEPRRRRRIGATTGLTRRLAVQLAAERIPSICSTRRWRGWRRCSASGIPWCWCRTMNGGCFRTIASRGYDRFGRVRKSRSVPA